MAIDTLARSPSHQLTQRRYAHEAMANRYPSEYRDTWRDRREKHCLLTCLQHIPVGGHVLDLPCGTGRMTRLLVERGYRVTSADLSETMLERAAEKWENYRQDRGGMVPQVKFEIQDIVSTTYPNDHFDGVSCVRLFHHFTESPTRLRALSELARISKGPIVVTFLNSFALDRLSMWFKHTIRGSRSRQQLPISYKQFASEIYSAGLKIDRSMAAHWGISSRWFLVLSRH